MSRPIIDFDQRRVFIDLSDIIAEANVLQDPSVVGATQLSLKNSYGISNNDFLVIGELGASDSEIVRVNGSGSYSQSSYAASLYGETTSVGVYNVPVTATKQNHSQNTPVYKLEYDQAYLYEAGTIVSTMSLIPDSLVSTTYTVSSSLSYQSAYYNSSTTSISPLGMPVSGYDRLLCTASDMRMYYQDIQSHGVNLVRKMELARDDIRRELLRQNIDINDFTYAEQLKGPAASLACYYVFNEVTKSGDDVMAMHRDAAWEMYTKKIKQVTDTLVETDIRPFGFTQFIR